MNSIATRNAIFKAANELHTSGHAVTIRAVIAKIRGDSNSTVAPLLKAWHSTSKVGNQQTPSP